MKFIVYDRGTMSRVPAANAPWALISICEKGDFPEVNSNEFMKGRLNLKYHDVDRVDPKELKERILFDAGLAKQVVDFYSEMNENGVELMFIHCAMGMCRSPATAAALQKIETDDDHIWFATKRPNMLVYREILNHAADVGLLG